MVVCILPRGNPGPASKMAGRTSPEKREISTFGPIFVNNNCIELPVAYKGKSLMSRCNILLVIVLSVLVLDRSPFEKRYQAHSVGNKT